MVGRAVVYAAFLLTIYIGALAYFDQRSGVFHSAREIGSTILPVCLISVLAFGVRCGRWKWLLAQGGSYVPWAGRTVAYLAGFALTASPGKVGELIRIRYFAKLGVPPDRVVACLIVERATDVIVLLMLSTFVAGATGFWLATMFAALAITGLSP